MNTVHPFRKRIWELKELQIAVRVKTLKLYHSTTAAMKKHKRTCKSKQQNRCFAAAKDFFSDESDSCDEDDCLPNEELAAVTTPMVLREICSSN